MKQHIVIPDKAYDNSEQSEQDVRSFLKNINNIDDNLLIPFIKVYIHTNPDIVMKVIDKKTSSANSAVRDKAINIISAINPPGFAEYLWKAYDNSDSHLKQTALTALFKLNDHKAKELIPSLLNSDSTRIKSAGIVGALSDENDQHIEKAIDIWIEMLSSTNENDFYISLSLIPYTNDSRTPAKIIALYKENIINYTPGEINHILLETLSAIKSWPENNFNEILPTLDFIYKNSTDEHKINCIKCCRLLDDPVNNKIIEMALDDTNSSVCYEAARHIYNYIDMPKETFTYWLTNRPIGTPRRQNALIRVLQTKDIDHSIFEQIAYCKSITALEFNKALDFLSKVDDSSSSTEIIVYAIKERIHDYIDLALLAMQATEHPDDINTIRSGLKSKDIRHIANANEIITHLKNKKVTEILSMLINKSVDKKTYEQPGFIINNVKDAVTWCKNNTDPWISYCSKNMTST